MDTHKSMGPDGMHPRVLRELADVIAEPLSIISDRHMCKDLRVRQAQFMTLEKWSSCRHSWRKQNYHR